MKEIKYDCFLDMTPFNSTMELDSNTKVARLEVSTDIGDICATVNIIGDVRVHYGNDIFKCASQMPEELIRKFHNWKPEYEKDVEVGNNNWAELTLYTKQGDEYVDANCSDVVDVEGCNPEQIKNILFDSINEYIHWAQA